MTVLPGPPTLYHFLLSAGNQRDLSSLRLAVTGAADIPVELIRRVGSELPFQSVFTGYGLKVPRHVEFLAGLPLNAAGKVMKDLLR